MTTSSLIRLLLAGTASFLLVFLGLCARHLLLTSPVFSIREISVTGLKRADRHEVSALSGIRIGDNIFSADLGKAARAIASHPWVEEVRVRRALPEKVEVRVKEWTPAAVLSVAGKTMYVDDLGRAFAGPGGIEGLPRMICSRGGEDLLPAGISALSAVRDGMAEVLLDSSDGVTLRGGHGGAVHFGFEGFRVKGERARRILRYLRERGLAPESMDMDFSDRAFVRLKEQ